jgi:restriction system protein
MADITHKRNGEISFIIFDLLWDKPDGLPAKEILSKIPEFTELSEYEKGSYPSDPPNKPRYEKIARFATLTLKKAGWFEKNKGRWYLTDEGKDAYEKYKDPEIFFKEAKRLYQEWKKNEPVEEVETANDEDVETISFTIEEAEENSWDQIQEYLYKISPYDFQDLVADLLSAMGYHVSWVAPPGKDQGIDIIAYTDPLGAKPPRIKVQVKRKEQSVSVGDLRSFLAVLGSDELGVFVSSSGFSKDAEIEARNQERRKITLIDLESLFDLWLKHYDKLSQDAKQRFPLRPIYFLAKNE